MAPRQPRPLRLPHHTLSWNDQMADLIAHEPWLRGLFAHDAAVLQRLDAEAMRRRRPFAVLLLRTLQRAKARAAKRRADGETLT